MKLKCYITFNNLFISINLSNFNISHISHYTTFNTYNLKSFWKYLTQSINFSSTLLQLVSSILWIYIVIFIRLSISQKENKLPCWRSGTRSGARIDFLCSFQWWSSCCQASFIPISNNNLSNNFRRLRPTSSAILINILIFYKYAIFCLVLICKIYFWTMSRCDVF